MKRLFCYFMLCCLVFLFGCSQSDEKTPEAVVEEVTNQEITLVVGTYKQNGEKTSVERQGIYSGQLVNGVPQGKGEFTTENDEGVEWTYIGDFKDGLFDGNGKTITDSDDSIAEIGNYTDGFFTPNDQEFIDYSMRFFEEGKMTDKAIEFYHNHKDLFPVHSNEEAEEMDKCIISNPSYAELSKNITEFGDGLITLDGISTLQVYENTFFGRDFSWLLMAYEYPDGSVEIYVINFLGSTDIIEGDIVNVIGLPMGAYSYDNVSGGKTNAITILGSEIEKVQ